MRRQRTGAHISERLRSSLSIELIVCGEHFAYSVLNPIKQNVRILYLCLHDLYHFYITFHSVQNFCVYFR